MATHAAILSVLVSANTSNATRGLMRFNTQLGATEHKSNAALNAVKTLAKGAAIGTGLGLGYAIKKAADFEQQLDSLAAVSNATGREMEQLRKQAMKAGADTKYSALQAAEAQTELAKGGLKLKQIMAGGLRAALGLASAGELELADAAEATVNAMKLFGLRGKDAMKVADGFATAANQTTADVSDFALALKMGGSAAKAAGLTFTETTSIMEAMAEGGIKGSDAGTSMKAMLVQLAGPTAKQLKLTKQLGVSFFDAEGSMKPLPAIADMLRTKLKGMSEQQRLATVKTLAGTDGMRAMLSIYDAGPSKMAKFQKGLEKQGTAARVAAQKEDNLRGKLENLQGSIETIAIAIGTKMLPSLTKAAEKITKVLNDPKLSTGEKFQKLTEMMGSAFSDGLTKLAEMAAKAGPKVAKAFATSFLRYWYQASPLAKVFTAGALIRLFGGPGAITKSGAKIGALLGGGISGGTAAATGGSAVAGAASGGLLAKMRAGILPFARRAGLAGVGLALADSVMTEFGRRSTERGPDMFKALEAAGKGTSVAGSEANSSGNVFAQMGAFIDKVSGRQKDIEAVHKLGPAIEKIANASSMINGERAARLRKELAGMHNLSGTVRKQIRQVIGDAENRFIGLTTAINKVRRTLGDLRSGWGVSLKDMRQITATNLGIIKKRIGLDTKQGWDLAGKNFQGGVNSIKKRLHDGTITTKRAMSEIANLMKLYSKQGALGAGANFDDFRKNIKRTMTRSGHITKAGMAMIKQTFIDELRMYGLSPKAALAGANVRTGEVPGGRRRQDFGQRGLIVRGGKPVGDSVHAVLERGEVVVNRRAVQKLGGPQKVNQLNQMIPRFQSGGIAGMTAAANKLDMAHFPYVWGGGHQGSPAPFGPMDCSGAVSFVLQHGGVKIPTMVSGALASAGAAGPGKVTVFANPTHTFMRIGNRYFGTSGSNPGGGAGWMPDPGAGYRAGFAQRHFSGVGGSGALKRVMVEGTDSPLKSLVQGVLDKTRSGAQSRLDKLSSSVIGAGDVGDPGPGGDFNKSALKQLWNRAGGSAAKANIAAAVALAESGGLSTASNTNSDGSIDRGLWQINSVHGAQSTFDPFRNALAAVNISSGGSNWNPWTMYTNGGYRQFLQSGGVVGMQSGGVVGSLRRTLSYLRGEGTDLLRNRKTKTLLGRIRRSGQFPKISGMIDKYRNAANIAGDFADRAGLLTTEDANGKAVPGVVNGKNEVQYVQEYLEALFRERNWMVRLHKAIAKRRAILARALKLAIKARKALDKRLRVLRKHPKQNRTEIRRLTRTRNALTDKFIPAIKHERGDLWTTRGDNLGALDEVQGPGSPLKVYKSLPALGVLGGSILDAQVRLRDLAVKPTAVTDTASDTSEGAEALAQLLREANQRTAVSQAQYDVFKNMPQFGGGGVVAGVSGAAVPAVVHGGEGVFTKEQMAAMGSATVQVIVNGDIVNVPRGKKAIEVRDVRGGSRAALPGRGGGVTRRG